MIFKVVCRADGGQLARYLLSSKNDQVAVLQVSGTVEAAASPSGLKAALQDMDELGKMTRGTKTLVHLAINPNDYDRLQKQDWQYCVAKAEQALGLDGQPRAIVSHVFEGKEHLHVVWSRVDIEQAKCIELPFCNLKMVQAAREVEIDLGLQRTPERNRGMAKEQQFTGELKQKQADEIERQLQSLPQSQRGSHQLSQEVIQQEKFQEERAQQPKEIRSALFRDAWNTSTNGKEFQDKIACEGYQLAQGDRGIVAVDGLGEVFSVARLIGVKQKEIRVRLADLSELPSVDELRHPEVAISPKRAKRMTEGELKSALHVAEVERVAQAFHAFDF